MVTVLGELLTNAATIGPNGGVVATDGNLHTWESLDRAAAHVASCLRSNGVGKGDRVAIVHPKSVWSFVAVHAVVRCGAVMVPIDPLGPPEAVDATLRGCRPTAIIGETATIKARAAAFVRESAPLLIVNEENAPAASIDSEPQNIVLLEEALVTELVAMPTVAPRDVAYIIFTSGSTGEPKGITHTHQSAMAYVRNALEAHGVTSTDRVAGTSPLHFDMSTLELYVVPLAGATAVTITEGELRFPASLSKKLADAKVSIIYAVPYQLRQLCGRGDLANRDLSALRQISFGGEQFAPAVLEEIAHTLPPAELLNMYGPAEVNVVIFHRWPPRPTGLTSVPIGRPMAGVDVIIVDEDLEQVQLGEQGELLTACGSQMQGYWEKPEVNRRCFVDRNEKRWYRTGDIVHVDDGGLMHFHGRADTRVKVRGVRLELETIETALSDMPGIDSSVVGIDEHADGLQVVVAWIQPDGTTDLTVEEIRQWCKKRLPSSAVPTDIRMVESFASSPTGKIDRKALRSTLRTAS